MAAVVFINCSSAPYIDMMCRRYRGRPFKALETRSRRTLDAVVGRSVLLTETGRGTSTVRASAVFGAPFPVRSRAEWDRLRPLHRVPVGSRYDWTDKTRVKWLYPVLESVPFPSPFHPSEGVRHGYVWMEIE